jgi:regulator of replication initiation timing
VAVCVDEVSMDDFTEKLREEVWTAIRQPADAALVRSAQEAARQFLEPLIREIGELRVEVDRLREQLGKTNL